LYCPVPSSAAALPKSLLGKMVPRGRAAVELQQVVPHMYIIEEVERSVRDLLLLRCIMQVKVPLAAVQPGEGIADVIKFRKLYLVRYLKDIGVGVALRTPASRPIRRTTIAAVWWQRDRLIIACHRSRCGTGDGRCACPVTSTAFYSSLMRDTSSPCCRCLTSRRLLVTNSSSRSSQSHMVMPSKDGGVSFPKPEPVDGDMVGEPGLTNTRLSRVGETGTFVGMSLLK
jgi:hypothetical protein